MDTVYITYENDNDSPVIAGEIVNSKTTQFGTSLTVKFENVVGHQISGSTIQMMFESGDKKIITNFQEVEVIIDDEAKERFKQEVERSKAIEAAKAAKKNVQENPDEDTKH